MRLFFALWPDAGTRASIANAAAAVPVARGARFVPRENYHLTLAFVGEVASSRLALLLQMGHRQRAAGCTIEIDAYDYWPEPQVLLAVARETPAALIALCTQLHGELALHRASLNPGRRRPPQLTPLRVHVTLARKVAQAPVLPAMSPFRWSARSFSLVRSDTSGAHAVYTVVDTWPLLDETPKP